MDLLFPKMRYDHTMPLLDGRIEIPGVTLKPVATPAMVWEDQPELRTGAFGLGDLNGGYWLSAIEAGWELIGLPLFIKRKSLYQYLFVRNDAGIEVPGDLAGKRIGTASYPTGITIQLAGLLQGRHGVDVSSFRWVVNRKGAVFPLHVETHIEHPDGPSKAPWDRLLDGEVDAIMTDISDGAAWERLEGDPGVRRLFDYQAEDKKLYDETGVYPVMHLIVMSKTLDREHPDLARKLYDGFEAAKTRAYEDILNDRAGFSVVYLRERLVEQTAAWGDPWVYGVAANRNLIDRFIEYNAAQGITSRKLGDEEIFAAGTLET